VIGASDPLDALIAQRDIERCLREYARGVDRRDWDLVRACYHDDAVDSHGSYTGDVEGFVAWVARRHEHVEQSLHVLGNVLVEIDGDRAFAETTFQTFQHRREDAAVVYTHAAGRYLDAFERRGDPRWRIARREVVIEFVHRAPAERGLDDLGPRPVAARGPDDLLYARLGAWRAGGVYAGVDEPPPGGDR
jgi:3-phenylpropionate/cinnamic acid dioxygenase small subunit